MDSNWTEAYYQDVINMTYQDLVKCIGEPHFVDEWDIDTYCQWHFELDDLTHFSIYDWKESNNYQHLTGGKLVEWHIGHDGKPGTLEKVKTWLHDKGVEVDKSMYYKIKTPEVNMNIQVEKMDIRKIGNACYNEGGFLAIMCDGDTCNIEEILLRSILKCFGDDYKIIKAEDYIWENEEGEDVYDILFITNLPYEIFEKII